MEGAVKMSNLTSPKETATRVEIDKILKNLGWKTNELSDKNANVFTGRFRTKEEEKKIKEKFLHKKFPDYVLYSSYDYQPLAVIEAKKIGSNLEKAITQAKKYAECIDAKIIFSIDGALVEARWVDSNKNLKIDGQLVTELLPEKTILKLIESNGEIKSPQKVVKTKEDLIKVFAKTNKLLRYEGMREGVERFTEFANFLFLKLIDEIEEEREMNKDSRRIEKNYCWKAFYKKPPREMLDYINDTVLPKLVNKYNHSGDVFADKLRISNPENLKKIVDSLSDLNLLSIGGDVKGEAFEYFLKNSVTVGNDLGEYYTPRHIIKLMVELVNPKFGDKVYDPCCGTGGFLIEAFKHIKKGCSLNKNNLNYLENKTIYGDELTETAKIAKMNMILAGDGHTDIIQRDSLEIPIREKFEIILTNFPFAQETNHANIHGLSSKKANPVFLMHVINSLKENGTAAVIVPDSILFSDDMDSIAVRKILIERCEIHGVINLSVNIFLPYTKQPTTILIFKKGGKTKKLWFFELENDGFIGFNKRRQTDNNDLPLLRNLWGEKSISNRSFLVNHDDIDKKYKLSLNIYKQKIPIKNSITLGEICEKFIIGITPSKKKSSYYGGEFLWVTISDIKNKIITDTNNKLSKEGEKIAGERRVIKKGTLLMSFKLTIGKTAFAGKNLCTNEAICALILKPKYDTEEIKEYLYHIIPLINYSSFSQRAAKGPTLNKKLIPSVQIPFPEKEKRIQIVKQKIRLISNQKNLIEKLENEKIAYRKFVHSDVMGITSNKK